MVGERIPSGDPAMDEVDTIGGAVVIIDCVFDRATIREGERAVLAAMVETHALDGVDIEARWYDSSGRGVSVEYRLSSGTRTIEAELDHQTAMGVWGRGPHELFLTIGLAAGQPLPPGFHGPPNDPVACGTLTVE